MKHRRYELTPEREQAIVAYVRAGGFPQVAAEAAGVPREVFDDWLRRGQGPRARPRYRAFVESVRQAQAQARLGAEATALSEKPLDWLRNGPGRETAGNSGWTGTVRPATPGAAGPPLLDARFQEVVGRLLTALEPFPEARATVASAFHDVFPTAEATGGPGAGT